MEDTQMKRRNYNGIEPWHTTEADQERFRNSNYVKVMQITPMDLNGGSKRPVLYRFIYVINQSKKILKDDNKSTLSMCAVTVPVEGLRTIVDIFRVRREFEVQANSIVNRSRAKNPNFLKDFEKIELQKTRWGHWYPGVRDSQIEHLID